MQSVGHGLCLHCVRQDILPWSTRSLHELCLPARFPSGKPTKQPLSHFLNHRAAQSFSCCLDSWHFLQRTTGTSLSVISCTIGSNNFCAPPKTRNMLLLFFLERLKKKNAPGTRSSSPSSFQISLISIPYLKIALPEPHTQFGHLSQRFSLYFGRS